jgi:hypothetical protein
LVCGRGVVGCWGGRGPEETYHGDDHVDPAAREEPVYARVGRRRHAGVLAHDLGGDFLGAQVAAIVPRAALLGEAGAVRGRGEALWFGEHAWSRGGGFAAAAGEAEEDAAGGGGGGGGRARGGRG